MAVKTFTYKTALEEIEDIVQKIENEEIDVDELSSLVKKAADLIKKCKAKLRDTELELDGLIEDIDN